MAHKLKKSDLKGLLVMQLRPMLAQYEAEVDELAPRVAAFDACLKRTGGIEGIPESVHACFLARERECREPFEAANHNLIMVVEALAAQKEAA